MQQLVNYVFWGSLPPGYLLSTTICAIVKQPYQRVMNDIQRTRLSRRRIWILPPPLSRQKVVFLSLSSWVSPVELTHGRGEEPNQQQNLCCDTDPHLFCSAGSGSRRAKKWPTKSEEIVRFQLLMFSFSRQG